ncbi:hypothetical protein GWK26_08715 [haloarchaeon 3A1-DGR]|nr:hypothetical protein GWK26_08715 [haloarchaeon 3A1-DGR]
MDPKDEKIKFEVVKIAYDSFRNNPPRSRVSNEEISNELEVDISEIDYILDRIDGDEIDKQAYLGGKQDVEITASGIEFLADKGVDTLLNTDTRYHILENLYQEDYGSRMGAVSANDLLEELDLDEDELLANVEYLKQKNLLELFNGYDGYEITNFGRERYEGYQESGIEIPSSRRAQSRRQAEIGRGDHQEAENLFRDVVELAQDEVRILDRYAREPLYDWVDAHIHDQVDTKVLTSDSVTNGSYASNIKNKLTKPSNVEVREISNQDWDFHDRYLIRDEDMGWAWGHSFHDSAERQHTATELEPVNLETVSAKFNAAWKTASKVI